MRPTKLVITAARPAESPLKYILILTAGKNTGRLIHQDYACKKLTNLYASMTRDKIRG